MSLYHGCRTLTRRFRLVLSSFLQSDGLPFGDTLPEEEIERAFDEEDVPLRSSDEDEDTVYTPAVTLWAFLSQMLHRGEQRSCTAAVSRMVVLLSLATGMLCDMAMGPYQGKETGEPALFRELLDRLAEGDIVLADRYYCSYFMIVLLMELGVDFVVRLHQRRTADFRRGRRLGRGDHLVEWRRPVKPSWMDQETYDKMPASIEVREVLVHVDQPGFRTESLVVVTTLCDAEEYAAEEIAELYRSRWLVELDIRAS